MDFIRIRKTFCNLIIKTKMKPLFKIRASKTVLLDEWKEKKRSKKTKQNKAPRTDAIIQTDSEEVQERPTVSFIWIWLILIRNSLCLNSLLKLKRSPSSTSFPLGFLLSTRAFPHASDCSVRLSSLSSGGTMKQFINLLNRNRRRTNTTYVQGVPKVWIHRQFSLQEI